MLAVPIGGVALGIALVRMGWARQRLVSVAGWALVALGVVVLAVWWGAWGIAVGGVVAMMVAAVALARAAWLAPAGRVRAHREPASVTLPGWRASRVTRRVAVFALVVPVAFAGAQVLAFGGYRAGLRSGWAEADAIALALFLQPTAWAIAACVQMTQGRLAAMLVPPAACAAAGLLLWWPA